MDKKFVLSLIAVIVIGCLAAGSVLYSANPTQAPPQIPTGEIDFTVSGSSDCLRFLNDSVPTVYVPFTVAAQENWQLTINATKMPGGASGWTDVYVYDGYWDGGTNHTCKASDLYPIISDIKSTNLQVRSNLAFTETFGSTSSQHSWTVFFVFPPGGQATFHVTLKPASAQLI